MKDAQLQAEFDHGMKAMEAQNYSEAARIFDHLLLQKPGSEMDLVAQFNSGSAYEGLGECPRAAERFHQVVRSAANKFSRIESESLFHLSLMYECLGQDIKTVTALLDAKKRGKDLPPEVLGAEIPARLAAAYSRLGNRAKALEYFDQASRGLKTVLSRGASHTQLDQLTRTMYLMGQLSPGQRRGNVDPTTYMQSISMQQPYLLQCVEMKRAPWSTRAKEDLQVAYDNIWHFQFSEPEQKHILYTRGLQSIQELKKIRMPKAEPALDELFAFIDKTESQLHTELIKVPETTRLTPEAEKREGIRRDGRLVNPNNKP